MCKLLEVSCRFSNDCTYPAARSLPKRTGFVMRVRLRMQGTRGRQSTYPQDDKEIPCSLEEQPEPEAASTECSVDPTVKHFITLFSFLDHLSVFHLWGIASSRKYGNMDWKFYQVSPLQFGLGQLNSFPTHSSAEKNLDSASSVTPIIANQKKKRAWNLIKLSVI